MSTPTYWHGGDRIEGDYVLPPTITGTVRSAPTPWVYVTPTRGLALTYACTCQNPWLYEVEPIGEIEQEPNSLLPAGEALRCQAARIVRRWKPSRVEVARRLAALRAAATYQGGHPLPPATQPDARAAWLRDAQPALDQEHRP